MVISIQGVETQDMKFRPAVETWFGLRKRRITPGVTFLQHWRSMEPSQSAIVLRNKDAAAKVKKSAVKKPTSRTANQLNFPPNPAAVKDASSSSPSSRGGEAPAVTGVDGGGNHGDGNESGGDGGAALVVVGDGSGGVGAAADVPLSELPAKAPEKAVLPSARPTANPWFNKLRANSRKREEANKKERQAKNQEKEREKAAKAAVDLLGGGEKRKKKDADIPPVSAATTAVEAPILAGDPPEVPSPRKKQKNISIGEGEK